MWLKGFQVHLILCWIVVRFLWSSFLLVSNVVMYKYTHWLYLVLLYEVGHSFAWLSCLFSVFYPALFFVINYFLSLFSLLRLSVLSPLPFLLIIMVFCFVFVFFLPFPLLSPLILSCSFFSGPVSLIPFHILLPLPFHICQRFRMLYMAWLCLSILHALFNAVLCIGRKRKL